MKKVELLLNEPFPELICGICLDLLQDPTQVHCQEDHVFCSHCINTHLEQASSCPSCLSDIDKDTLQLSKFAQRQIGRLRARCMNSEYGCSWEGQLSEDHILKCKYKVCSNADKGCTVKKMNMKEHEKICLYQTIECAVCQSFMLKDLPDHERQCKSYTCPYSTEGCTFMGTLSTVNDHCDNYCGRLHRQVLDLENQITNLNEVLRYLETTKSERVESTNTVVPATPTMKTPIKFKFENPKSNDTSRHNWINRPNEIQSNIPEPMEITNPSSLTKPAILPKRAPNGQKICYSKNKELTNQALNIRRIDEYKLSKRHQNEFKNINDTANLFLSRRKSSKF